MTVGSTATATAATAAAAATTVLLARLRAAHRRRARRFFSPRARRPPRDEQFRSRSRRRRTHVRPSSVPLPARVVVESFSRAVPCRDDAAPVSSDPFCARSDRPSSPSDRVFRAFRFIYLFFFFSCVLILFCFRFPFSYVYVDSWFFSVKSPSPENVTVHVAVVKSIKNIYIYLSYFNNRLSSAVYTPPPARRIGNASAVKSGNRKGRCENFQYARVFTVLTTVARNDRSERPKGLHSVFFNFLIFVVSSVTGCAGRRTVVAVTRASYLHNNNNNNDI